ncbi:TetR/AcrR family transcriptional regulator [Kibdelosporangium phytohabitans]|uniref:TetR family transcriptional regulator n=1 Tax=Kibdelosporangium phytohabitans TaxID=860235 RepID=A0A0N9I486_9PSEU|nr:TetR/AcrR family transcriptional regulator [Kibdelosporangium phytohabitans]ALG09341.1 TetR family transcriptional regulator [Kibdelosporangium phytohabitans]MBE1469396.1 AcrR family transcriptional regulator [Kibdelosporangium phytohabitans]
MSPRRSAQDTIATRDKIVARARLLAASDGLEGITIGRLADALGMSKAGVIGHFGTKETLQVATLDAAVAVFQHEVIDRVTGMPRGIERLLRLCEAWLDYLADGRVSPGGCFLTAAASEFDGRPGPVHDAVAESGARWLRFLEAEARAAVAAGDLPGDTDPGQIAFELNGIAAGANQVIQLHHDLTARDRAWRAMRRICGRDR